MEQPTEVQGHLVAERSERGFTYLPAILGSYINRLTGSSVQVHESSSASGPHIWLRAKAPVDLNEPDGPTHEAPIHLTAENAWRLAEQLMLLVRNHYQGDATPEWVTGER